MRSRSSSRGERGESSQLAPINVVLSWRVDDVCGQVGVSVGGRVRVFYTSVEKNEEQINLLGSS